LLASSIYLGVHAWESALACAERAAEMARQLPDSWKLRREAAYCVALSLRMMLRSPEDVSRAKTTLEENMAGSRRQPVVWARDAVERATLQISACVIQVLSGVVTTEGHHSIKQILVWGEPILAFDDAVRELEDVLVVLAEDLTVSGSDEELIGAIALQGAANRLGAELLRHYLGPNLSRRPADLHRALRNARKEWEPYGYADPLPHPVAQSYLIASRFEVGDIDRKAALQMLGDILKTAVLTQGDEIELRFIQSAIEGSQSRRSDLAVA
jgi:hypothetical protein